MTFLGRSPVTTFAALCLQPLAGDSLHEQPSVSLAELKLKSGAALELITDASGGFERRSVKPEGSAKTLRIERKPGGGFAALGRRAHLPFPLGQPLHLVPPTLR